jgi:hypothetical protein
MEPPTIPKCSTCLQFKDFEPSISGNKVYYSAAQQVSANCPDGTVSVVPLDAGVISYTLNFSLGNPPYPNLVLNCLNGVISVPVPDDTTQSQLDALITGMINECLGRIAVSIGCQSGTFFNTQQSFTCGIDGYVMSVVGALPPGVTVDPTDSSTLIIQAAVIQSLISIDDANAKAMQVLNDVLGTGNAVCSSASP